MLKYIVLVFALSNIVTTNSSIVFKKYSKDFYKVTTSLIVSVIKDKNCDLVFAHDINNNQLISEFFNPIATLDSTGGGYFIEIRPNASLKGFNNLHKKREGNPCSIVFIIINQTEFGIFELLFELLTPRYNPLVRKDEDYFFFMCPNEITEDVLLSQKFGDKIKNKVALVLQSSGSLILKTIHPYLNYGSPVVITLNLIGSLETLFQDMTGNHYGRAIKMSCPKVEFRLEIEWRDGKYHPKRGYYKYWLDEAMKKFNFTYDLFQSSLGGGTGVQMSNGTWTGAMGDVLYEEAEIAFVVGHIQSRHKFVEWSAPLSYEWFFFVCPQPKIFFSAKAIFGPFQSEIWGLFLLSLLIIVAIIKHLIRVIGSNKLSKVWTIPKVLLHIYSSILDQDGIALSEIPHNSIRIVWAFWLLFALIVATAYRTKLVSVILFPVKSWVPSTFEELSNSEFGLGLNVVGKGGAAYDLFRSSSSPAFKRMFFKMTIHPDALECQSRAVNTEFCCCLLAGVADYIGQKNLSDRFGQSAVHRSTSTAFFLDDGLIYQKRAIFRHHFDRTIWNAISMGLINQWIKMDWTAVRKTRQEWEKSMNKTQLVFSEDKGPQKLQVEHFIGAFAILFTGCVIGSMAFAYEFLSSRK